MSTIKVMIFEDEVAVREELVGIIEETENMSVVGQYGTSWAVLEKVSAQKPDVILMDIGMPSEKEAYDDEAGIGAILRLRDALEDDCPAIIIVSHFQDDDRIFKAFCAGGAIGYLIKPVDRKELTEAIRKAYAGDPMFSSYIASQSKKLFRDSLIRKNAEKLTEREKEALIYLKQGYTQTEAAEFMEIKSINDLLKSIYPKLQVHSQQEAINNVWYNPMYILRKLREAHKR